jgi:serine protease
VAVLVKVKSVKVPVFAFFASLIMTITAQASSRVLVVLKSPEAFSSADRTFKANGKFALNGFNLGIPSSNPLANVNGRVEDSLSNIRTLVVTVANESEIEKLQNNPDVALVEKEIFHPAPRPFRSSPMGPSLATSKAAPAPGDGTFTPGPKTPWGILAVKAPQAWATSHSGEGARVMILDTGIDRDHPSLKANFEKGQDFVGDHQTPYDYFDKVGHGSHVSGTIAGVMDSTGFVGVAPKAKILMGRVCSEAGCSNVAIAQGINWGIQEKVDVISMSLGGSASTPGERSAVQKADAAGVTVVAASGNDGTGQVSYPAALATVIAVGAVDNTLAKASFSQYGPELAIVAPGVAVLSSVPQGTGRDSDVKVTINGVTKSVPSTTFTGAKEVMTPESNTLVDAGLGQPADFTKIDVKGKYALIARGVIAFGDKVKNALAAGAVGAVIYNNAPGLLNGALTQDGSVLPAAVFMVEQSVGQELVASLAKGQTAGATVVVKATDYAIYDGTSMATPHVAGVVALIKATNKNLKPSEVKALIQSTAQALGPNTDNEFGAGLINAEDAVRKAAGL